MTVLTRRDVLAGSSALIATSAYAQGAYAQAAWPSQPITIVQGFAAGGPIDTVARIIAEPLSKRLGQNVLVEARPGATGTIAAGQVARATPDGHTLIAIASGHAVTAATFKTLPYRPVDDFSMISLTTEYPLVMVTHSEHPAHSIADLLQLARSQPTPLVYGTPGSGSFQHLAVELFAKTAGIKLQHIPYRGTAQALTDIVGKRLDIIVEPPTGLLEFLANGKLRALAVTGPDRFFRLPDVPTVAEAGVPGYTVTSWQGLAAPAGLPAPVVDRLNREVIAILNDPTVAERMRAIGNNARPSKPQELRDKIADDIEKWTAVVAAANIERI
jgi:tripartite-type tricarboxylate transporter receptor subunit TctC